MAGSIARTISKSLFAKARPEGVGATVRRAIGGGHSYLDPFLMCDDFTVAPPAGFPDHPHRGFETVTYLLEGAIAHEDFAGNKGIIGPGDIQWMTAGKGIVHAEMPASPTPSRGIQLWLNLSADQKMIEPSYQDLKDKDIPRAQPEEGVEIKVIAGESHGVQSPVFTRTPSLMIDFSLVKGKKVRQEIPKEYRGFIYVIKGSGYFGETEYKGETAHVLFLDDNEGDHLNVEAREDDLRFVLFAGKPLNERIVQHGPFVMNADEQIYQAIRDYNYCKNGFERAKNWRSSIADGVIRT
ncbi:1001_t:CDS:2 [Paraglomus occultum]|uniref:1001_t:CDS:1 n=1 Tax=Paraglomus occultum TaxID=144539 RepID=A0A9N8VKF1_9GLOM|nr:1001_t:CDS:2 [Paraglomus occultum]